MSIHSAQSRRAWAGNRARPGPDRAQPAGRTAAEAAVTDLYAAHALGLTRLAQVMLGDRAAAEDVVHDAFAGLFRRWAHLEDPARAPQYLRSAVLNGCRNVIRGNASHGRAIRRSLGAGLPDGTGLGSPSLGSASLGGADGSGADFRGTGLSGAGLSGTGLSGAGLGSGAGLQEGADAPLLAMEERRAVLAALRALPPRRSAGPCWPPCAPCRPGSGRRWCSATTWTCRTRRSPRRWASGPVPSARPCTGAWRPWSGSCARRPANERACERIEEHSASANADDERQRGGPMSELASEPESTAPRMRPTSASEEGS